LGTEARARLSLVALLALTLFTFGQVFDATDYVGPALLAIGVATGLAIVTRRGGLGSTLSMVISLILMLIYLVLVFAPHQTLYGLPTIDAGERLWRAIDRAMAASRTDFAPVPMRTGYVILIVAGMWLAATFAEVAAFRWKRPLLATLLPTTLFCLVMVVGTQEAASFSISLFLAVLMTFWALEAAHRLRSWGRAISAWSHRATEEIEAPAVTGSLARRMGAATVAVAIISPLLLPAFGDGLLAWRTQIGEGPGAGLGGGGSGSINQLVSIAPRLIRQTDQVLLNVHAEQPGYWRLGSLADFDGRDWRPLQNDGATGTLPLVPEAAPVRELEQRFELTGLQGDQLPAAVQANFIAIDFRTSNPRFDEDRLITDREGSLRLLDAFEDQPQNVHGLSYDVTSFVPAVSYAQLRDANPASPGPAYVDVPSDLSDDVKGLVRGWVARAQTPLDKLIAIQDQLRGFEYSLDVEPLATTDYLSRFLLETRAGYCQQFATAFAILARFQGFATRVSVGFLPGEQDPGREDRFVVRGTHAHAWPEVYFSGVGWVPFEPTPRSATTPPGYTVPGSSFIPGVGADGGFANNPSGAGSASDAVRGSLGDVRRGGACETGQTRGCSDVREVGAGDGLLPQPRGPRGPTVWEDAFERLAAIILVAVILFLIVVPLVKQWRTAHRYRAATDSVTAAAAAFAEFESEAGELASPRSPSETATSYATRIASMARVPRRTASRLAGLYEQSAYSASGVSRPQADEARRLARELRGRLWSTSSWWERGVRLFSPRGLRTG
jgi:transglutaminase-like putative cysteine protease